MKMSRRFEISQYKEPTYKVIGNVKVNKMITALCHVEYKFKYDGIETIVRKHGTSRIYSNLENDIELAKFMARLRGTIKAYDEIQNILLIHWHKESFKPEQNNLVIDITELKDIVEFLKEKLSK